MGCVIITGDKMPKCDKHSWKATGPCPTCKDENDEMQLELRAVWAQFASAVLTAQTFNCTQTQLAEIATNIADITLEEYKKRWFNE